MSDRATPQSEHWLQRRVGDIVADHYTTAFVFKKYGIDFCCGGGRPLQWVCQKHHIDPNALIAQLKQAIQGESVDVDALAQLPLNELIDRIVQHYHQYIRYRTPIIQQFAEKVARVYGHAHPETVKLLELWQQWSAHLLKHLEEEETYTFPFIKEALKNESFDRAKLLEDWQAMHRRMIDQHQEEGTYLERMRELTDSYRPPDYACRTFRVLYQSLAEFEDQLLAHVHLENNVLFPRFEAMLKRMSAG